MVLCINSIKIVIVYFITTLVFTQKEIFKSNSITFTFLVTYYLFDKKYSYTHNNSDFKYVKKNFIVFFLFWIIVPFSKICLISFY